MKRTAFFTMVLILLSAMIISACASKPEEEEPEEMDFSGEVSGEVSGDGAAGGGQADVEEEGFEFTEDEVDEEPEDEIDISEEEAEDFELESCLGFPDYVPCGTFWVGFDSGTMTCTEFTEALELETSPDEFLTLVPRLDGKELFAVATGSGEGTIFLLDVLEDGTASLYSGPLTNFQGRIINFTFTYFSHGDGTGSLEYGELKVVINNPAGAGGKCTIVRTFDAPQQ